MVSVKYVGGYFSVFICEIISLNLQSLKELKYLKGLEIYLWIV